MKALRVIAIPFVGTALIGLASVSCAKLTQREPDANRHITIMSYNVENLFDNTREPGRNDWTFLPANYPGKRDGCLTITAAPARRECLTTDWSDNALRLKLAQLARVITGDGVRAAPDFLALIEVSSGTVVHKLGALLGYPSYLITHSPDARGINVALLFKKPAGVSLRSSREIVIKDERLPLATRNILEADFVIDGRPLSLFVNHWPSQAHPVATRLTAARLLHERIAQLLGEEHDRAIIALGDFNTLADENPHPFATGLLQDGIMMDAHTCFLASAAVSAAAKGALPPGTFFFAPRGEWNLLDHIFLSRNLLEPAGDHRGLTAQVDSYRIVAEPFAVRDITYKSRGPRQGTVIHNVPRRFNVHAKSEATVGFSDHLPVTITLRSPP